MAVNQGLIRVLPSAFQIVEDPKVPIRVLPSAFQIVEYPTYLCSSKCVDYALSLCKVRIAGVWDNIKKTVVIFTLMFVSFALGGLAYSITICFTPVTCLADIVIGIAECSFRMYQGCSREDILKIARCKFIVSPLQHIAVCVVVIVCFGALWAMAVGTPIIFLMFFGMYWYMIHKICKILCAVLPIRFIGTSFSIFIGGTEDMEELITEKETHLAQFYKIKAEEVYYSISKTSDEVFAKRRILNNLAEDVERHATAAAYHARLARTLAALESAKIAKLYVEEAKIFAGLAKRNFSTFFGFFCSESSWTTLIKNTIKWLTNNGFSSRSLDDDYSKFKNLVLQEVASPRELLSLPVGFTQRELKVQYIKFARILHPDKSSGDQIEEKTELFKLLQESYKLLKTA